MRLGATRSSVPRWPRSNNQIDVGRFAAPLTATCDSFRVRAVLAVAVQAIHNAEDSTLGATCDGELITPRQGRDQEHRMLEADAV